MGQLRCSHPKIAKGRETPQTLGGVEGLRMRELTMTRKITLLPSRSGAKP